MTKKFLSDTVLFKLAGGMPDGGFAVDERDIWAAIDRLVNAKFKVEQLTINLPSGETIPNNLHYGTYEDVAVSRTSNNRSKCTLPILPISLPKNMGIVEIRPVLNLDPNGDKILGDPIIPLQYGQAYLLGADTLLNDLMGQFGYEPNGATITFTKDLTTFDITSVDMKLAVFDISQYSATDEIPIPSDYIDELQNELVKEFAFVVPESGLVNNFTNLGQSQPGNGANGKK